MRKRTARKLRHLADHPGPQEATAMRTTKPHILYRRGIWRFTLSTMTPTPSMLTDAAITWCGKRNAGQRP